MTSQIIIGRENPITDEIFDSPLKVGSLGNPEDVTNAVDIIVNGGVVAAQIWGVFGLWMRADNVDAIQEALRVKGDRNQEKKLSVMMFSHQLLPLVDREAIHPALQPFFTNSEAFRSQIGSLFHVRVPIRSDRATELPSAVVSLGDNQKAYLHNLDPSDHPLMSNFIHQLQEADIPYVAVTSLNDHSAGEPEITDPYRAKTFCQARGISLLLTDPLPTRPEVHGSFAIVDCENSVALRDGVVPIAVISAILNTPLMTKDTAQANYPTIFPTEFTEQIAGKNGSVHSLVLAYLLERAET